jgi:hypothetical protein
MAQADVPDHLTLKRHRDLVGRRRDLITKRIILVVLLAVAAAGLVNVFGQRPGTASAGGSVASLDVYAPSRVRGGLYFEARFRIHAHQDVEHATLVLDPGWLEGMTINTLEPSPLGESSRNGRLALDFGHVPAGHSLLFFMQLQVNPTNVGHRSQDVELDDGTTRLATVHHTVTVFP